MHYCSVKPAQRPGNLSKCIKILNFKGEKQPDYYDKLFHGHREVKCHLGKLQKSSLSRLLTILIYTCEWIFTLFLKRGLCWIILWGLFQLCISMGTFSYWQFKVWSGTIVSGQVPVKQRTILPPKPRLGGERQAEKADLCSLEPRLTSVLVGSLPIISLPFLFSKIMLRAKGNNLHMMS